MLNTLDTPARPTTRAVLECFDSSITTNGVCCERLKVCVSSLIIVYTSTRYVMMSVCVVNEDKRSIVSAIVFISSS